MFTASVCYIAKCVPENCPYRKIAENRYETYGIQTTEHLSITAYDVMLNGA